MIKILLAQKEYPLGGWLEGIGPLGEVAERGLAISEEAGIGLFNRVISNVIGFLTVVGGIWFILQFIIGGVAWITAGGDKAKVEQAQKRITHGVIGMLVLVVAVFLIDLISGLIGLDILSPTEFIINLWD